MTQIELLESEIKTLQAEIYKLQKDYEELSLEPTQSISGSSANELIENIESTTKAASERQQRLTAIQATLPILGNQLEKKQAELQVVKKQQREQELKQQQTELEPELLTISRQTNELSEQLDALCERYRVRALEYNKITSELKRELTYPITMDISNLPCVTKFSGRGFNLRLAGRMLGSKVSFEQLPARYVVFQAPVSMSQLPQYKIAALKSSLSQLESHKRFIPTWDKERVAMAESQINEIQQQLQQLEKLEVKV